MSHFIVMVLLSGDTKPEAVKSKVNKALAPYDENREVAEYDHRCYCVGNIARNDARRVAMDRCGTVETIRQRFNTHPETAELRRKGAEYVSHQELGITKDEHRDAIKAVEVLWRTAMKPYEEVEASAFGSHSLRESASPTCEECSGRGTYKSTRNPKSKWDWFAIGGRWAGWIRGVEEQLPADENPFVTGDLESAKRKRAERESALVNTRHVVEMPSPLPDDLVPFAIVTLDGEWHEKGEMGWFACVSNERADWGVEVRALLESSPDALAVAVDCHI